MNKSIPLSPEEQRVLRDVLTRYIPIAAPVTSEEDLELLENLLERLNDTN